MVPVPRMSGGYGGAGSRCASSSWLRGGRHPTSRPSRTWPFRATWCTGLFGTLDLGEVFQVLPEGGHCGLVRHELGSGSPVVQQRSYGVNPGTSSHQGVTHIVAELQQLSLGERRRRPRRRRWGLGATLCRAGRVPRFPSEENLSRLKSIMRDVTRVGVGCG